MITSTKQPMSLPDSIKNTITNKHDVNLIQQINGGGSNRSFFRLFGEKTMILLYNPSSNSSENQSLISIGNHLKAQGIPVPKIYCHSIIDGWIIMEDLGDLTMNIAISVANKLQIKEIYCNALNLLADFQVIGEKNFQTAWCYDQKQITPPFFYNRVFKFFTDYGIYPERIQDNKLLDSDFLHLTEVCFSNNLNLLNHRDFQSKNLIINNNKIYLLDFHGCRYGPVGWDVACLVADPYTDIDHDLRYELVEHYSNIIRIKHKITFMPSEIYLDSFFICRYLQLLASYNLLVFEKGKNDFIKYRPCIIRNLLCYLTKNKAMFPELHKIVEKIHANQKILPNLLAMIS